MNGKNWLANAMADWSDESAHVQDICFSTLSAFSEGSERTLRIIRPISRSIGVIMGEGKSKTATQIRDKPCPV